MIDVRAWHGRMLDARGTNALALIHKRHDKQEKVAVRGGLLLVCLREKALAREKDLGETKANG